LEFINQLSAAEPSAREKAERDLISLGELALPQAKKFVRHPNLELRLRCRRVALEIELDLYWKPVNDFAADTNGELGTTLPGWPEFLAAFGEEDEAAARQLFADMVRCERELMQKCVAGKLNADELYRKAREYLEWHLVRSNRQNLVSVCVVFFAMAHYNKPHSNSDDPFANSAPDDPFVSDLAESICSLSQRLWEQVEFPEGDEHAAIKRGARNLASRLLVHNHVNSRSLTFAITHKLPECIPLAKGIIADGHRYLLPRAIDL
jgi:hypothetical protein